MLLIYIFAPMKVKLFNINTSVFYIIAAVIIGCFFPREGTFRYQFFEGKPWHYGLLTAPNDFPVYKTDGEIQTEKDSVLRLFEPYYRIDPTVETAQVGKMRQDYATASGGKVPSSYMLYIEREIIRLYQKGIVSPQDAERLRKDGQEHIKLVENNVSRTGNAEDLLTVREAYEHILNNSPQGMDRAVLQSSNVNNYLTENATYDKSTSDKVEEEMLNSISVANGMVQAGERIVDRGEIVDAEIYNVLRSLKSIHESRSGGAKVQSLQMIGVALLIGGIIFCFWLFLWSFRPEICRSRKHTIFLLLCILTGCVLTELCVSLSLFNVYIMPYAIVPIVVCTFFDSRTALFTHLVMVLICSIMVPFPHEFLLMQTLAGMVVNYVLVDLSERSQLIRCALYIFLSYALCYTCLAVYQLGDFYKLNWVMYFYFAINFVLLMFAYLLVYILEKVFGYISAITLVELSNINNPILKKLSETAPGTFQHSLQVSILASEAAAGVGANAALARTGALYHDIGKIPNPAFFTENRRAVNPHDQLTLEQSARIIINHVSEGIKIAEKARLPEAIVSFIRTHHGSGKAKYFYNSYKNLHPDGEVDDAAFTYPGPDPFTKEMAVVMMADSVEAASRSLAEYTDESISRLVNKIIDGQIADGLMKHSPLTFADIETGKRVFIDKLKTMYHTRISYPEIIRKE
ncbi:hypothetical protein Barb4_00972 [Bacteroidales bacterium Barb4]|nr:hypothetical protein Barb4_00972 [Bacteroidales bacterium Barb4]